MSMRGLPLPIQALLATQMLFNVGFYLVVPFLAVQLTHNLGATSTLVGLVLGIRTFSQQGLFFLGGGLADRYGAKPILLIGIAIRILGFLVTGFADSISVMVLGVVLIGFAAALFSPAVEATFAHEGQRLQHQGVTTRSRIFALDNSWSRIGSLTGPILGALLIPIGFNVACLVAAAIFAALLLTHAVVLPAPPPVAAPTKDRPGMVATWAAVLRTPAFLWFALLYSTYLAAYNQQYLALPVELRRGTGSDEALGWMFTAAAIYVIACQGKVHRVVARWQPSRALLLGFGTMAMGFLAVALLAPTSLPGWWGYLPAALFTLFLHGGIMVAVPIARDLLGRIAGEQHLGSFYGFLNSFGGLMVLLTGVAIGSLLDHAETPGLPAIWPWLAMAVLLGISAVGLYRQAAAMEKPPTFPLSN